MVVACALGLRYITQIPLPRDPFEAINSTEQHIVERHIRKASADFERLLLRQSHSYEDSVLSYQARRGRAPPPGFLQWYCLAEALDAVVIEEFWDPIYEDLEPFWNFDPEVLRSVIQSVTDVANDNDVDEFWIQNGRAGTSCFNCDFCDTFGDMLQAVVGEARGMIPDIKMAVNAYVSPRIWTSTGHFHEKSVNPEITWDRGKYPR